MNRAVEQAVEQAVGPLPAMSRGCELLVSVRSADEAIVAVASGVEIIDVKEPDRGSLGRASVVTIDDVITSLDQVATKHAVTLSVALGELTELEAASPRELDELAGLLAGGRITFAKMGLVGVDRCPDWTARWLAMRARLQPHDRFRWIAVAYADARDAGSPAVSEVARAARGSGAAGMLIDTFHKDGRGLLDHLSLNELRAMRQGFCDSHCLLALAGGLDAASIRLLIDTCPPDIIAVRGAACEGGARRGAVNAPAIAALREVLAGNRQTSHARGEEK